MSNGFYILYPEQRFVTDDKIQSWYADAVANGEIECTGPVADVYEIARQLDEAGIITLRKGQI